MIASYDPHFVRVQNAAAQFFPREPHGMKEREREQRDRVATSLSTIPSPLLFIFSFLLKTEYFTIVQGEEKGGMSVCVCVCVYVCVCVCTDENSKTA